MRQRAAILLSLALLAAGCQHNAATTQVSPAASSSPTDAVRAYYSAIYDGNWPALEAVTVNSDVSTTWLKAMQRSEVSDRELAAAIRAKFGDQAFTRYFPLLNSREITMKSLQGATASINGDKAAVDIPMLPGMANSKYRLDAMKVNGMWKVDARQADSGLQMRAARALDDRAAKISELSKRVAAGEFNSADDVRVAYRTIANSLRRALADNSSENSK